MAARRELDELRAAIRGAGLRATPSRLAVLALLRTSALPVRTARSPRLDGEAGIARYLRNIPTWPPGSPAQRSGHQDCSSRRVCRPRRDTPHVAHLVRHRRVLPTSSSAAPDPRPRAVRSKKVEIQLRGVCEAAVVARVRRPGRHNSRSPVHVDARCPCCSSSPRSTARRGTIDDARLPAGTRADAWATGKRLAPLPRSSAARLSGGFRGLASSSPPSAMTTATGRKAPPSSWDAAVPPPSPPPPSRDRRPLRRNPRRPRAARRVTTPYVSLATLHRGTRPRRFRATCMCPARGRLPAPPRHQLTFPSTVRLRQRGGIARPTTFGVGETGSTSSITSSTPRSHPQRCELMRTCSCRASPARSIRWRSHLHLPIADRSGHRRPALSSRRRAAVRGHAAART